MNGPVTAFSLHPPVYKVLALGLPYQVAYLLDFVAYHMT